MVQLAYELPFWGSGTHEVLLMEGAVSTDPHKILTSFIT